MRRRLEAEKKARESMPVDTTKHIWEDLFEVRMPMLGSRSIDDIRRNGVVISGVKELDADIKNRLITSWITIDRMCELFKENVPVYLRRPDDSKTIYKHISDHIEAWKYQLEKGINIGDAPVEDLILMDEFAHSVFGHAKWLLKGETIDNIMARHFSTIQTYNVHNIFNEDAIRRLDAKRGETNNVTTDENGNTIFNAAEEDPSLPTRDSYSDFFKECVFNLNNRRR